VAIPAIAWLVAESLPISDAYVSGLVLATLGAGSAAALKGAQTAGLVKVANSALVIALAAGIAVNWAAIVGMFGSWVLVACLIIIAVGVLLGALVGGRDSAPHHHRPAVGPAVRFSGPDHQWSGPIRRGARAHDDDGAACMKYALEAHRAEQHAGEATATAMAQYQHVHVAGPFDQHARRGPGRDHDLHGRRRSVARQRFLDHGAGLLLEVDLERCLRRGQRMCAPLNRVLREERRHDLQAGAPPTGLGYGVLQGSP
jgi:hypothetical protein